VIFIARLYCWTVDKKQAFPEHKWWFNQGNLRFTQPNTGDRVIFQANTSLSKTSPTGPWVGWKKPQLELTYFNTIEHTMNYDSYTDNEHDDGHEYVTTYYTQYI